MTSESEMTKTRLLERIQTGWEELMDVLAGLDDETKERVNPCLLYTSPSPRD